MSFEAISGNKSVAPAQLSRAPELVSEVRKKASDSVASEQPKSNQVPPEELLKQIKSLTEDGLYSVRFENDERANGLVVKIVDQKTGDVIRQVPAEEVLELRASLDKLSGNLVNTEG